MLSNIGLPPVHSQLIRALGNWLIADFGDCVSFFMFVVFPKHQELSTTIASVCALVILRHNGYQFDTLNHRLTVWVNACHSANDHRSSVIFNVTIQDLDQQWLDFVLKE
jgi:hypothetical protein